MFERMSIRIAVVVNPRAKQESVTRLAEGNYRVSVHAPPQAGRANRALIELLAQHFAVPKSAVRIVRGPTARQKLIEIDVS